MTVYLDVWTVRAAAVGRALVRMARDPRDLAGLPGLRFHKSLGTGAGRHFTARDADLRQWALLTVWDEPGDDRAMAPTMQRWQRLASAHSRFTLAPIASHGQWSGAQPFEPAPGMRDWEGPLAAITRARVRMSQWRAFQKAVPPVAADLADQPGLLYRIGIGEAPIGLQGTFSVWADAASLRDFAYRQPAHLAVIDQTRETGWYSEELFARFAVTEVTGGRLW